MKCRCSVTTTRMTAFLRRLIDNGFYCPDAHVVVTLSYNPFVAMAQGPLRASRPFTPYPACKGGILL